MYALESYPTLLSTGRGKKRNLIVFSNFLILSLSLEFSFPRVYIDC